MLEGELDKIHDFQKAKVCALTTPYHYALNACPPSSPLPQTTELSNRIKIAEKQVKKLVSEEFITTPSPTRHGQEPFCTGPRRSRSTPEAGHSPSGRRFGR
jgi:hypothetical protein